MAADFFLISCGILMIAASVYLLFKLVQMTTKNSNPIGFGKWGPPRKRPDPPPRL